MPVRSGCRLLLWKLDLPGLVSSSTCGAEGLPAQKCWACDFWPEAAGPWQSPLHSWVLWHQAPGCKRQGWAGIWTQGLPCVGFPRTQVPGSHCQSFPYTQDQRCPQPVNRTCWGVGVQALGPGPTPLSTGPMLAPLWTSGSLPGGRGDKSCWHASQDCCVAMGDTRESPSQSQPGSAYPVHTTACWGWEAAGLRAPHCHWTDGAAGAQRLWPPPLGARLPTPLPHLHLLLYLSLSSA